MQLIFCVTLILILSNCSVGSGADDVIKELEKSNENHYGTKFTGLNADCVFLIFEHLDFHDLLNVAQINDKFSILAADEYRHKYSHLRVSVWTSFAFPTKLNKLLRGKSSIDTDTIEQMNRNQPYLFNTMPIFSDSESISLENYESIWITFKHFGHEMKRLHFYSSSSVSYWNRELLGYLISEYIAEPLVGFECEYSDAGLLNHIKKPLINVENVKFKQALPRHKIQIVHFCELFPSVRHLDLNIVKDGDLVDFDCHMPHLKHVGLAQSKDWTQFPDFISKNPQIKSIHWVSADPEMVQKANTLLPQLETLTLTFFELERNSIQFENVTTFDISDVDYTSPENLHFPQLQTLRTGGVSRKFADYLAFLNEHKHLRHLHLRECRVDDSQFQQLTANLADLVEMTLSHGSNKNSIPKLSSKALVEFLRSHEKVKQLNVTEFPDYWIIDLQELLKEEWNKRFIDNGLSFERKWKK